MAISVDPPATSRAHVVKMGFTYPFLSDEKAMVIKSLDLLHAGQGEGGADIARPAEFLIDPTGTVRWRDLTEDFRVRARPATVLEVFDRLNGSGTR